jgi:hypothetical protein
LIFETNGCTIYKKKDDLCWNTDRQQQCNEVHAQSTIDFINGLYYNIKIPKNQVVIVYSYDV